MPTLYVKTADGLNEIETRARRISPRARSALILVDGKRTAADIGKMIQQADETLQSLLELGLIEVSATKPAEKVPDRPAPSTPEAFRDTAPAPAAPPPTETVESQRREAVRAVNDLLGPQAESLAIRLEAARNRDELRAALERAAEYIANARGTQSAQQFASRFLRTLPR
jgi:hypothetical protein